MAAPFRHLATLVATLALASAAMGCDETTGYPDSRPPDATPLPGSLSLTWTIESGGVPATCADVGGISLRLGIREIDSPLGTAEAFGCESGAGTAPEVTPGTYQLTFDLIGAGGTVASAPTQTNVVVEPSTTTDLGNIVLATP